MTPYVVLIVAVALERLAELVVSRRNLAWALAHGGREYGFGHYPFMVVLHTGLLVACLVEATHRPFCCAAGPPRSCSPGWWRRCGRRAPASRPGGETTGRTTATSLSDLGSLRHR